MYKIIIEKTETNENFKAEIKAWKEERQFGYSPRMDNPGPQSNITKKYLETVLTDEEFAAIKKAVLEIM